MTHRLPIAVACLLAAAHAAFAWDVTAHRTINAAAAEAVPDAMRAWSDYADLLAKNALLPDLWRDGDETEKPRHYVDLELFGDPQRLQLQRDRSAMTGPDGQAVPEQAGTAPWVVMDLQAKLRDAMAGGAWPLAARIAAAQGHYVADTHQPLHLTDNHDGQHTGNRGIHRRWEDTMPEARWSRADLEGVRAAEIPDPWTALCAWIFDAYARVPDILEADNAARDAAHGDTDSPAYFDALWASTSPLYLRQVRRSAEDLAGLWYRAWVDAGRPFIPPPPDRLSDASVHTASAALGVRPPRGWRGMVFLVIVAVAALLDRARRARGQLREDA